MSPSSSNASVPPEFLRNSLENGVTPDFDDPMSNSPEPSSPESETTESETTESWPLTPDYLEPYLYDFILPDWWEQFSYDFLSPTESSEARKTPPNNGYTSKVRVLDRYKVVGFISSGTYGRVYKAVGHNEMAGEFAIKKFVHTSLRLTLVVVDWRAA